MRPPITKDAVIRHITHAPLFRDPAYVGAVDTVLVGLAFKDVSAPTWEQYNVFAANEVEGDLNRIKLWDDVKDRFPERDNPPRAIIEEHHVSSSLMHGDLLMPIAFSSFKGFAQVAMDETDGRGYVDVEFLTPYQDRERSEVVGMIRDYLEHLYERRARQHKIDASRHPVQKTRQPSTTSTWER